MQYLPSLLVQSFILVFSVPSFVQINDEALQLIGANCPDLITLNVHGCKVGEGLRGGGLRGGGGKGEGAGERREGEGGKGEGERGEGGRERGRGGEEGGGKSKKREEKREGGRVVREIGKRDEVG